MGSSRALSLIADGGGDRRTDRRARVLLSAQLHSSSQEYRVRIRDMSTGGVRVEAEGLPRPGTAICLQRGCRVAYGVVAWAAAGSAGIAFDEPLAENFFAGEPATAPRPDEAHTAYRRPGFGRGDDSLRFSDGKGWIDPADLHRPR